MRSRSPAFSAQNLARLVATCVVVAGCGTSSSTAAVDDGALSDGADAGDDGTTLGDDGFSEPENDGLDLDGGTLPLPSADAGTPIPTKLRYVLVLIKENHTFDNYFTGFPGAESATTGTLSTGATLTRPAAPTGALPKDLCHSNACGQRAYAGGKMNGFDLNGAGQLPFVRYTEAEIPNYWQYARNFVLADHFFSTTLGPSTPGHAVFWTARSLSLDNASCNNPDGGTCAGFGCKADKNTTITAYDPDTCATKTTAPCFDVPALTDHLPKDFTWSDYGGPLALMVKSVAADPGYAAHFRKQADLVTDLGAGRLANLTIAHLWSTDASEHPAASPCTGENLTVDIVNAAMKLPQWNEMAIVVTWDDWGGFYDHVAPTVHKCSNGQIFQEGFRLPAIVISPYAKKGLVLHTPTEQASVPRLVEELWGMTYMSTRDPHARDGAAGSLMGAFDFTQAPRAPLPLTKRSCP